MAARRTEFRRGAIGELMESQGLGASEFARRANLSRQLIRFWVSGMVTPQVESLVRLCNTYGVPISFFFGER